MRRLFDKKRDAVWMAAEAAEEGPKKDLLQKLTLLDKYLLEINENTEIYTYQGIFQIDSKNIYKLLIIHVEE
jgi:hypothetical protein